MKPVVSLANSVYGFYEVGEHWAFLNKADALYKSSKYNKTIKWNFHDSIYSKFDWSQRPAGTLAELYRDRAQQIRDKYDYVRIDFSGGMDSWTVLHSFLSNNIHVDEVYTRWAFAERKYRDTNAINTNQENLLSEYDYAVVPVLEHIRKNYPKTHVVVDDYSECFETDLTEKNLFDSNQYQSLPTFFRFNRKSQYEQLAVKQGKSVAVVLGYEKIRCVVQDGNFYAHFIDRLGGTDSDLERTVELFYWSPDFPTIPILQAHCVKDYLVEHIAEFEHHTDYRKVYQPACYPDYNSQTFQVAVPVGSLIWDSDQWIRNYNPRYYNSWKWSTDQYFNGILTKHISKNSNNEILGFTGMKSPMYLVEESVGIGNIDFFSINTSI
jgi:hypothetical protein